MPLTHVDEAGDARMVEVSDKVPTAREARASGQISLSPEALAAVRDRRAKKGDVLTIAQIAGIQAAKRTSELIPLCHQIALSSVSVDAEVDTAAGTVTVSAVARTRDRTGVEMEALTACSIAALTIYDMVKGIERGVSVDDLALLEKTGGRHDWRAPEAG